jgi:hypothetical protein
MKNLRDAILAVLNSASNEGCDGCYVVDADVLWILQQEFNIHFVEPDQPQFDAIDKP